MELPPLPFIQLLLIYKIMDNIAHFSTFTFCAKDGNKMLFLSWITLSEIDRKEARANAMRSAILETFPEPNRRLLQRCFLRLLFLIRMPVNSAVICGILEFMYILL